jgi:DDE superfamily endonuclease
LWKADVRTSDYHDNMNNEMFYKWVPGKLLPTFEKMYPRKKMILILDNASYHHRREINNLGSLNKLELKKLCDDYKVEHLDIPLNINRMNVLASKSEIAAHNQDENCRVYLNNNVDVFIRALTRNPMIPTSEELLYSTLKYLAIYHKELLECKVERLLKQHGHKIVWTPPYSPDLQPIELFWTAGKNHVANNHKFGRKMKEW